MAQTIRTNDNYTLDVSDITKIGHDTDFITGNISTCWAYTNEAEYPISEECYDALKKAGKNEMD